MNDTNVNEQQMEEEIRNHLQFHARMMHYSLPSQVNDKAEGWRTAQDR
jgi:hypothetical protein